MLRLASSHAAEKMGVECTCSCDIRSRRPGRMQEPMHIASFGRFPPSAIAPCSRRALALRRALCGAEAVTRQPHALLQNLQVAPRTGPDNWVSKTRPSSA